MRPAESETIVYLDLDDVLVDWKGSAIGLYWETKGLKMGTSDPMDTSETHIERMFDDGLEDMINRQGPEWWENLPPMPYHRSMLELLYDLSRDFRIKDWRIVTNPHRFLHSYEGKRRWMKRWGMEPHHHVMTSAKHLLAKPNTILIDDLLSNCQNFSKAGGHAYLYPDRNVLYAKNSLHVREIAVAIAKVGTGLVHGNGDGITRRHICP